MTSPLPTLIAELEEALKAATPGPWRALTYENSAYVKGSDVIVHKLVNDPSDDGPCGNGGHSRETIARWHADARLIALMRNHLPALIEALKRQGEALEAAQKLVSAVDDLISESHGVYGLHQNGDIAPWDTLIEGGRFEEWLLPLSTARAALKETTGGA